MGMKGIQKYLHHNQLLMPQHTFLYLAGLSLAFHWQDSLRIDEISGRSQVDSGDRRHTQ